MPRGSEIFDSNAQAAEKSSRTVIWFILLALLAFVVWAANAPLNEIVRSTGRVVPATKTQIVQNLEGGIVRQLHVTEGDIVEQGQLLANMDETQFNSAFQELVKERLALQLRIARLEAEATLAGTFEPDPSIAQAEPQFTASEVALFEARRSELRSTLDTLQRTAELRRREAEILRPMAERNAVPEIELIRAEQAANEAEGQFGTAMTEFETRRSEEFATALADLFRVEEQMRARQDQLDRTRVTSPVYGIVNKVLATTIGGVVRPGEPLVEILPLGERLRIEGRVDPRDIGFVYAGMPATVKLSAFDFTIYGSLDGEVVHVGADTVIDEDAREQAPYYEVYVELNTTMLEGPEGEVEIRPGMLADLELQSGQRTVLRYLLKPLFKASEALTER